MKSNWNTLLVHSRPVREKPYSTPIKEMKCHLLEFVVCDRKTKIQEVEQSIKPNFEYIFIVVASGVGDEISFEYTCGERVIMAADMPLMDPVPLADELPMLSTPNTKLLRTASNSPKLLSFGNN
eukprot:CAMPEP_0118723522 /NCGR_PEP_ID=MMETSP0800-20121206/32048_1 /TAXON_ID=210618 ORGANISM="Striatella unipunctata, Strain CCMP2910" /NCGR_SAMPLE_ID=MMETSP0800 /ASSEMBLY_ACC=CAM_ASM_000638 /LENGTH=123 /DNA_ID=CAMNT_0006631953 /DNA_START=253 /DNA_END=624 /DNA_ORIENTATION=-